MAEDVLSWFKIARQARWARLQDVRKQFPSADQVGGVLVINIRHNRYRLIVRVDFARQKLYIKALLTHKEYERGDWKRWA